MKLATYQDGSRDGHLVVVSRDLSQAQYATGIATRLQQVLDDWNFMAPQLQDLAQHLERGRSRHAFPFDPGQCHAPLPRVSRWVSVASALPHLERLASAQGREAPARARSEPVGSERASDLWWGPTDDVFMPAGASDWDVEPELTVLCGDIEAGASADQALEGVRLLALTCGWVDRQREAEQIRRGWGSVGERGVPSAAPVLVTPDELGEDWSRGRAALRVRVQVRGTGLGEVDASGTQFHAGQLLSWLARDRPIRPGLMLGLGVPALPGAEAPAACLLDRREQERATHGQARTPWLDDGDSVKVEAVDTQGRSVFGAVDTHVIRP